MKRILYILLFIGLNLQAQNKVGLICGSGQSNMAGTNDITSNRDSLNMKYWISPTSLIWDSLSSSWQYFIVRDNSSDYGISSQPLRNRNPTPFTSLAHNIDSLTPRKYYFVMHAIGGSQLYEDAGKVDWNVNSINEHYDSYKIAIQGAINELSGRGISIDTIYNVWFQGETDADDLTQSNAYEQNQSDLIDSLEANFNYPFKHYFMEIIDTYTYSSTVNTAKFNLAASRSNVILYENDVFEYVGVHITTPTQIELGDSLFKLIDDIY
jgi:hypothetical protein